MEHKLHFQTQSLVQYLMDGFKMSVKTEVINAWGITGQPGHCKGAIYA